MASIIFQVHGILGSVLQKQKITIPKTQDLADQRIFDTSRTTFDPKEAFESILDESVDIEITDYHTDSNNGVAHIFARQTLHGRPIFNAKGNLNILPDGDIVSSYEWFNSHATVTFEELGKARDPKINGEQAKDIFSQLLGRWDLAVYREALGYIEDGNGLRLCWEMLFMLVSNSELLHYACYIDAMDPKVIDYVDLVVNLHSPYLYNVWSPPDSDPLDGERQFYEEPFNDNWAPNGWQEFSNGTVTTNTIGNNVFAEHSDFGTGTYANVTSPGVFDYPIDFTQQPNTYLEACTVQLFYTVNWCHDMFYRFGFDEQSGNFQQDNYGNGGLGGDPVKVLCQFSSGTNNAEFTTPPDGYPGELRMYPHTFTNPHRSSSFDAGLVIHEYAHGVSNRLTGGAADVFCSHQAQADGMGEGWSDFFAIFMLMKEGRNRNDPHILAGYVTLTLRQFPFSSSLDVNPTTWAFIREYKVYGLRPHDVGEIWGIMLWEAGWNLIEAFGFQEELDPFANAGNDRIIQVVMDGLKLQPCQPTFIEGRDAIIEAARLQNDHFATNLIWRGFAMRGMGCAATVAGVEDYEHPRGCQQSQCVPQCLTTGIILDDNGRGFGKVEITVEVGGALSFHAMINAPFCGIQVEVGDVFGPDPDVYTHKQTFTAENNIKSWCFPVMPADTATFVSTNAAVHIDLCDGTDAWANGIRFDPSNIPMFFPVYKCFPSNFDCTGGDCSCTDGPCSCSLTGDCFCDISVEECVGTTCSSCPDCSVSIDCDAKTGPIACVDDTCTCIHGSVGGDCVAPLNIDCENAVDLELSSTNVMVTGSSTEFGISANETNLCWLGVGDTGVALWYKFTAPKSGRLFASTCGLYDGLDTFDTLISILQGTCGSFVCVAEDDDNCGANRVLSTVDFAIEAGQDYYILVHSYLFATGMFYLSVLEHGGCLFTTFNTPQQANGNMFDIEALSPIEITGFRQMYGVGGVSDLLIYIKEGSKDGFETDSSAWTLYQTFPSLKFGHGEFSNVTLMFDEPIIVPQLSTLGFYVTVSDPDARIAYVNVVGSQEGAVWASDDHIQIRSGVSFLGFFGAEGVFRPRNWAGFMCYNYFESGTLSVLNLNQSDLLTIEDVEFIPEIEASFSVDSSNDMKCELLYDFGSGNPPIVNLDCKTDLEIYFDFEAGAFEDAGSISSHIPHKIHLLHDPDRPIEEIEFTVVIYFVYNVLGPNEEDGFMGEVFLASRVTCPSSKLMESEGVKFVTLQCTVDFNTQELCELSSDVNLKMKQTATVVRASKAGDVDTRGNALGMDMSPSVEGSSSPLGGFSVSAANSPPPPSPPSPPSSPPPPLPPTTFSSGANCLSVRPLIDPDYGDVPFPEDQRTVIFAIHGIVFQTEYLISP